MLYLTADAFPVCEFLFSPTACQDFLADDTHP